MTSPDDLEIMPLEVNYFESMNVLQINDQDGKPIKFADFRDIHFGSAKNGDKNLCNRTLSQGYKITSTPKDWDNSNATFGLEMTDGSQSPTVTLTMYEDSILNIMWTYPSAPATDYAQVPDEIITKSQLKESGKISDHFMIDQTDSHLKVISKQSGNVIYEINGLTLEKYFN